VGTEENLNISRRLAKTNAGLLTRPTNILKSLGATIASSAAARELLKLS
jgi:uncharacterized protein (DUF849 family)